MLLFEGNPMVTGKGLPTYAVFDDYYYSLRIAVFVRWFLLVTWLFLHNYRPDFSAAYVVNNVLAITLSLLNGYVHWRVWKGRPITRPYAMALSGADLTFITIGMAVVSRFDNTFFVLYYPAILAVSLIFTSRRFSFGVVALVAVAYAAISIGLDPGVSIDLAEERVLIVRIATMFAVVAAANLMTRTERDRRRQAVEAERAQARRNLELQKKAQEAELAAQRERDRIGREIHDGIAQSIYALSLNLETAADMAERENGALRERLQTLVHIAKQTLLETRHYIYDLKPLLLGERDLAAIVENQAKEFETVSGLPVRLSIESNQGQVTVAAMTGVYRILQESLANILKHAHASEVRLSLTGGDGAVRLAVEDDGQGYDTDEVRRGYGLSNIRERAAEIGATLQMKSELGRGTSVIVTLPSAEVENEAN